jgi:DNA-directed RNA polymerase specialized sigma24 family protein
MRTGREWWRFVFYGGLTLAEISHECGLSESTVERRWRSARAWLLAELAGDAPELALPERVKAWRLAGQIGRRGM